MRENCKHSDKHYTTDKKTTLCGKKIPKKAFRLICGNMPDIVNPPACKKCQVMKDRLTPVPKTEEAKIARFKEVVEEYGGKYVYEDGEHKAWWDAYDRAAPGRFIAYGKLSYIGVWLIQNWLYLKVGEESGNLV